MLLENYLLQPLVLLLLEYYNLLFSKSCEKLKLEQPYASITTKIEEKT